MPAEALRCELGQMQPTEELFATEVMPALERSTVNA